MNVLMRMRTVAVLSLVFVMTFASGASAITAGGIGGRPANPDPANPRTQSIFIMKLNGGDAGQDAVKVVNNSGQPQQINLYAVDGELTNTGAYTCRQQDDATNGVGAWTKLSDGSVKLKSGDSVEVPFTVNVPKNADVGEHNGCIVFENADQDSAEAEGNVRIKTRQAVRLVVTVPGDLKRNIEITSFDHKPKNDGLHYNISLKNSGNVSADTDVSVLVRSVFGNKVYKNGGGYPVLPDQKLDLSFVQEKVPFFGGWYRAQVTMSYNKEAGTFGTSQADEVITKRSDDKLIYIAPTPGGVLVIGLAFLALVGGLIAWKLRRNYRRNILENGARYTVKTGDTIQSVADKHAIKWQKLASINHIKAPYTLEPDTTLNVPKNSAKRK